jgi:GR25 family glycosyltransferase involved in LPS biosynthesis
MIETPVINNKSPIVFIIYNRPQKTQQSFESIKHYKPEVLYIVSDGPKNANDAKAVAETRKVVEQIDWKCNVIRIYSDTNMSCGLRIYSGLNEVFKTTDKAIIIEDDIVVSPDFFTFCTTMLHHFENNQQVMAINGWNGWLNYNNNLYDAFLNKYTSVWGWATWKRAWQKFEFEPEYEPDFLENTLKKYFNNTFREQLTLHTYKHRLWQRFNSWDLQWGLAIYLNKGLVVTSSINLCSNIGFDSTGTHLNIDDFRGLYSNYLKNISTNKLLIQERYNQTIENYDLGMVLMNIVCMYDNVAKVMLLHKHPELIPLNQSRIGWQCQLEPFNNAALILEMIKIIEKNIDHPQLQKIKKVFQLIINNE